jgi:hypothetical protein
MMAKREKDRLYYEVTKEKPFGMFQMVMVGGTAGSILAFLIVSLVGAYEGIEMDSLILAFLLSSLLGFFFGGLLMWLFIQWFDRWMPTSSLLGVGEPLKASEAEVVPISTQEVESSQVVDDEEAKGKSVDFVFPELSPDKQ